MTLVSSRTERNRTAAIYTLVSVVGISVLPLVVVMVGAPESPLLFGAFIFMGLERMETGSGFGPSLWWSFTTLVTGGYADIHNPETASGKILTVFLVITGMVLVGVFTATLTSILVSDEESLKVEELEEQVGIVTKIQEDVKDVNERLDRLEGTIREIRDAVKTPEN